MPFNISPSSYVGPQLMMQGASSVGQGIAQMMENLHKARQDQAADDVLFGYAKQQGMIDPETEHKYLTGNSTTKNGIIAGVARKFALDMQQQQMNALKDQREAQAELRRQQTAAFNFAPDDEVVTDPLKINGQIVPGIGVNRKTGQYVYFGGLAGTGGDNVEIDPKTKAPFYRDAKGNKKFLTGQQIMAGQMMPPEPTPTPTATPEMPPDQALQGSVLSRAYNSIFGPKPAAAAVTPTPAPPTVDTGAEPVVPPQTPAPALSAIDQQALAWAQAHPGDPRSAKILQRLGVTQ